MTEFKRYRDANGGEFSSAISPELAKKRDLTDITSANNPAVGTDGKPLRAKPATPKPAAKPGPTTPKES